MKITVTLDIPENELDQQLAKENLTREAFVRLLTGDSSLLGNVTSISPGATFTVTTE